MSNSSKKIVHWGQGESTLFLNITPKGGVVLDYEYDTDAIHEMCGGRNYYCSCSCLSGAGYLEHLGALVPLGYYRVDTTRNWSQNFLPLGKTPEGEEVWVAVPYATHTPDKSGLLREFPTVVKVGGGKVVYCDFSANLLEVLDLLLSGEELPEKCVIGGVTYDRRGHRTLRRVFTRLGDQGEALEEEVVMEHYNLCSMDNNPNPWEFFEEFLREFRGFDNRSGLLRLLAVERLEDGTFVRTVKINGGDYRGEILPGNPLDGEGPLPVGWQRATEGVIVRFYADEVHLVAYATPEEAANRFLRVEQRGAFVSSCSSMYIMEELQAPKLRYLLHPSVFLAEVVKQLADNVRQWADYVCENPR